MFLKTLYFLIINGTKNNSNEMYVTKEILPSKDYIPIDLGPLDESDFMIDTSDNYENNSVIRYEILERCRINEDYLSLNTFIDNLYLKLDQNSVTLQNESNQSYESRTINLANHYNTIILPIDDFFLFNKTLSMFHNDMKQVKSHYKYLLNLINNKHKSYEVYKDILLDIMKNHMFIPNIFQIDGFYNSNEYLDNIDLIFKYMKFIKEFDFSKLNIRNYAYFNEKNELYQIYYKYKRNLNFSIYLFTKRNVTKLNKKTEKVYQEINDKKISKETIISCIIESINIIEDPLDKIILYKCLFDILTRKKNINCLVRLLFHIIIYYRKGKVYTKKNLEFFLMDRLLYLIMCLNPKFILDLKDFSKYKKKKKSELFLKYYKTKSKDSLRENIEIHGIFLNLIDENQPRDYYYVLNRIFDKRCSNNMIIKFMSNVTMQCVIKILEDNKIL